MKKISKPGMTAKGVYQKPALYHSQNSLLLTSKITIMKKLLLPFLAVLLFTACQKQIPTGKAQEEIAGANVNSLSQQTIGATDWPQQLAPGDIPGDYSGGIITICGKDWMLKNLDVSTYRNGDPIPQVTDEAAWAALTTGAWCWYANDAANGPTYGKLYNWYAVNDPRGLAPTGWHVPSDAEWTTLSNCLGGATIAGGAMKEAGTKHWPAPNTGATNSSGFTALPGGLRNNTQSYFNQMHLGFFWSATQTNAGNARARKLSYNSGSLGMWDEYGKSFGLSVRCVRN